LWVVFDLIGDNLPDFVAYKSKFREVVAYYWIVMPRTLVLVLPIALILSLLYCLSQFSRHNELTAMRAGGISVSRLTIPYLTVGLFCAAVVFVLNEEVVPSSLAKAEDFMSWQRTRQRRASQVIRPFFYSNRAAHREWMADEFRPDEGRLNGVSVMVRSAANAPAHYYSAKSATWQNGAWVFHDLISVDYDETGQPIAFRNKPVAQQLMAEFTETPQTMLRAAQLHKPDHMTLEELRRRIEDGRNPPTPTVLRQLRMAYYDRFAHPWICVVVVLLGIPFGISSDRRGTFLGIANSLALFFAYYLVINIDRALGQNGYLNPVVAAWLPNVTFGAVGAFFLSRVR
jgi:lipopolysaccharide export system permease protein